MAARRKKPLRLEPETWGEQVKRAYLTQRDLTGRKYHDIAAEITELGLPCYVNSLQRLEKMETVPQTARQRLIAWLALLVYGFDPADFGIEKATISPARYTSKEVIEQATLLSPCFTKGAA